MKAKRKENKMIFTIELNEDYMGGSFHSFSFFHNEEELEEYLKHMMCWSGHISVIEKLTDDTFNQNIDKLFAKYEFSEEAINKVKELYKQFK